MALNAQMGKAGPPFDGKDLHIGDFDWGILPPAAPSRDLDADDCRHGDGVRARRVGRVGRRVVHRRRRVVARRMARGDQPVRGAAAAGDLLRREQSDGAVDAGRRSIGRARVCRQGRRLRHSRPHDRRHRSRSDRRGVRVGGRAGARGSGADAHRAGVDADVRPRASRRHAVSRPRPASVLGLPADRRAGLRRSRAVSNTGRRAIRFATYAARLEAEGVIARGDVDRFKREAEAIVEEQARAVIDAPWPDRAARRRRVSREKRRACMSKCWIRGPSGAGPHRSGRAGIAAYRSIPGRRSTRRAARSSRP